MGACNFIEFSEGKDVYEAFCSAKAEAEYEYGHDPYNGTISTCRLSPKKPHVIQKRFTDNAARKAHKHAELDDFGEKWEARAVDCGIVPHKRGVHMWAFYGWAAC